MRKARPALFFAAGRADFNAEARRRGEAETFQPCRTCRACREALRGTTEAGKAMNRLAAIVAESLSVPASKLAPGKRTPRHPFGFPGLAGHGSGLRPTRNFTEVSHLRFEVKSRGTYQATFRGASVSRGFPCRVAARAQPRAATRFSVWNLGENKVPHSPFFVRAHSCRPLI